MTERDIDETPYSPDEARVAKWFFEKGIGGGSDPIGSLISLHEFAMAAVRERTGASNHVIDRIAREQLSDPVADDLTIPLAIKLAEAEAEIARLREECAVKAETVPIMTLMTESHTRQVAEARRVIAAAIRSEPPHET